MSLLGFLRKNANGGSSDRSELASIYEQKGCYCQEYLDAFQAQNPKKNNDYYFTLCEIYTEMERYEDAKDCLAPITPNSILDDITRGQLLFCRIMISMETGNIKKATEIYSDKVKFLDRFMMNPARSKIAGDYHSYCAVMAACSGDEKTEDCYIRRLREWCDIFPKNHVMLEITQVKVLFARKSEKAEEAWQQCHQMLLGFSEFRYPWERDYFLKKLDRARDITHEA